MLDPRISLLIALVLVTVAVALFWPDWGFDLAASTRLPRLGESPCRGCSEAPVRLRVQRPGRPSPEHVGCPGHLRQSSRRDPAETGGPRSRQPHRGAVTDWTPDGRSYALRIIRIHRLWERYLSDETGFDPPVWHQQAELRETHHIDRGGRGPLPPVWGHPRYDPAWWTPYRRPGGEILPPRGRPPHRARRGSARRDRSHRGTSPRRSTPT